MKRLMVGVRISRDRNFAERSVLSCCAFAVLSVCSATRYRGGGLYGEYSIGIPRNGRPDRTNLASVTLILTASCVLTSKSEASLPTRIVAEPVRYRTSEVTKSGTTMPISGFTLRFPRL